MAGTLNGYAQCVRRPPERPERGGAVADSRSPHWTAACVPTGTVGRPRISYTLAVNAEPLPPDRLFPTKRCCRPHRGARSNQGDPIMRRFLALSPKSSVVLA